MGKISIRSKLTKDQIFTIPNILSFVRLALIPLIVWLYCCKAYYGWTLIVITISGITDIIDGFIARKYNMVTDFGKFIDPVADKLTQIVVLFCLVTRFELMWLPLIVMVVKEILQFTLRLFVFKNNGQVNSAEWHGKLATTIIYLMMSMHIVWYKIDSLISSLSIVITALVMILSCVLYTISIISKLKNKKEE